jgi:SAM-dependent methyltransferase
LSQRATSVKPIAARPGDRTSASSAERSRAFYRALGPAGLAIRTRPEWDALIVQGLLGLLPSKGRVLDVGCGYGRIAIPLAELGFDVTGIDIARNLLRAARRQASRRRLTVRFDEGSMTAMPYPPASFDIVISLWTAFYELLHEAEQVAALREMHRVLRSGGVAVIEGPAYMPPTEAEIAAGSRYGPDHRITVGIIAGQRIEHFAHDAASLERAADAAGIADRHVLVRDWAGRTRQLLVFNSQDPIGSGTGQGAAAASSGWAAAGRTPKVSNGQ